jgi:hypothetical protein
MACELFRKGTRKEKIEYAWLLVKEMKENSMIRVGGVAGHHPLTAKCLVLSICLFQRV